MIAWLIGQIRRNRTNYMGTFLDAFGNNLHYLKALDYRHEGRSV